MKQLLTFILLTCSLGATAQKYVPFPTANTKWIQREGKGDTTPAYSVIGMLNDSVVIGGNTYRKLYKSYNRVFGPTNYIGGMREDGAKHVYYYNATTGTEHLVYDFSLNVGDTIKDPMTATAVGVISYIDSVNISGVYHKRFNFGLLATGALWTGGTWIEGVGNSSLGGLLGSPMVQPTCDCATETICASDNSSFKYDNTKYLALGCEKVLETQALPVDRAGVTVVPNPLTGNGHLFISGKASYSKVTIYDMTGRVIRSTAIGNENSVALSRSEFNTGLYLYRLENSDGNTASGKFVVE